MPLSEQVVSGQIQATGWLELLLKLALVLLLVYVAAFLLQKGALAAWLARWQKIPEGAAGSMRTLAVHPLTPQVSLYLVEIEKRKLLLSVSAQAQAQLLLDFGKNEEEIPIS